MNHITVAAFIGIGIFFVSCSADPLVEDLRVSSTADNSASKQNADAIPDLAEETATVVADVSAVAESTGKFSLLPISDVSHGSAKAGDYLFSVAPDAEDIGTITFSVDSSGVISTPDKSKISISVIPQSISFEYLNGSPANVIVNIATDSQSSRVAGGFFVLRGGLDNATVAQQEVKVFINADSSP